MDMRISRSMSGQAKDYQHLLARIEILESAVDKLRDGRWPPPNYGEKLPFKRTLSEPDA